jgi:predicted nucleotidyltransferase
MRAWQRREANRVPARIQLDRTRLAEFCQKWGITHLSFFGSILRDDFGPGSDVDVLVEFAPGVQLGLKYVELADELSVLLGGRRVDLVRRKYLHPLLRERVLASAEVQYAA